MKYIYIAIKEEANLDLSIEKDFRAIMDKYRGNIEFIEYHLSADEEEYDPRKNLVDYLE